MYITIEEAILVQNKNRPSENDPIIFIRQWGGDDVLTLNDEQSEFSPDSKPYGRCYVDTSGNLCVVPDVWEDSHADRAKRAIY